MSVEPRNDGGATPGPWIADFHNEQRQGGRFVTYVRGGNQLVPIAAVPTGVEGYGREEGRANAALIAAAPDLRDALAGLLRAVDALMPMDGPLKLAARAALAKAQPPSGGHIS